MALCSLDGQFSIQVQHVYVVNSICAEVQYSDGEQTASDEIDILLGSALAFHLLTRIEANGTIYSRLGKFKVAERGFKVDNSEIKAVTLVVVSNESLDDRLQKFWDIENALLDSVGHSDDEVMAGHKRALDLISEGTEFKDGRYYMPLLFREGADLPVNNFGNAMQRLKSLERKFEKNPGLKERYVEALTEHIQKYATLVPADEIACEHCFYLPHAAVIREEKTTTKTRIVFDASAKDKTGVSLNDRLLPGPAIHPDITGILMRFRCKRVALVGDIKKMFLQVRLFDEDKKFHRFLWREDPSQPIRHYQMSVMTFGLADSPVKAILCIRMHVLKVLQQLQPSQAAAESSKVQAALSLLTNCFVDDALSGADDDDSAVKLYEDMVSILSSAGFEMRKFLSNSPAVMERIPEEFRGQSHTVSLTDNIEDGAGEGFAKALGLGWDMKNDMVKYSDLSFDENAEVTKRTISSEVARLFDPVGLISPFIMQGKILMQKTWAEKLAWDEKVNTDMLRDFQKWQRQIRLLSRVQIPRCIFLPKEYKSIELHCFSDASEKAIGAAVYCKIFYEDQIDSHLMLAKGKVASLKEVTLPRKELVGIVIGARLVKHAAHELNIPMDKVFLHTDSLTAWQWLRRPPEEWKQFVRNRCKIVHSLLDISRIFHVPGVQNPSDLVSRGCDVEELTDFWFCGPDFLRARQPMCPKDDFEVFTNSKVCLTERREKKAKAMIVNLTKEEHFRTVVWSKSNFRTFLNVTAYCMRAFTKDKPKQLMVTEQEKKNALMFWIREEQLEAFGEDLRRAMVNSPISGRSRLTPLNPFYDNMHQVLRVGGRLQEAQLPFDQTYPVILPSPHVSRLQDIHESISARLIMNVHERHGHMGADWVLHALRTEGFWLLRGKQSVRKVISRCVACQKAAKGQAAQIMGDLPSYRLEAGVKPFSYVGVDAAGPVYLKQRKGESGQRKSYVFLFTCLTSRAVHLELAVDQTAETLIQCFRRLIARRGMIAEVLSDNHKTNIRAEKEIQVLLEKAKDSNSDLKWRYTPEYGSWYGSCYERLIRSLKEGLRKVLGKSVIAEWELLTILCEIEASINDRPLCAVSDDVAQFDPVTPSMLLLGSKLSHLPSDLPREIPTDTTKSEVIKAWKRRQSFSKQFWRRWTKDYMLGLQARCKWTRERADICEGDLVLIATENQPRGSWPLARVTSTTDVHNVRDQRAVKTRSVVLRLPNGKETRRPVQGLVHLEVR